MDRMRPSTYSHIFKLYFIVISILLSSIFVLGYTEFIINLNTTGSVVTSNLSVYEDIELSNKLNSIDWGILHPGDVVNKTLYIHNKDFFNKYLSLDVDNWWPEPCSNYISVYWDGEGVILHGEETISVVIFLSIAERPIARTGVFDFHIIIKGEEAF